MASLWRRWTKRRSDRTEHNPTVDPPIEAPGRRSWSEGVQDWSHQEPQYSQCAPETGPSNDTIGWTSWSQGVHVMSQPETSSAQYAPDVGPSSSIDVSLEGLTLISEMCNREDNSLFDCAVGNNNSDMEDEDPEPDNNDDEDDEGDNDDGENIGGAMSADIIPSIPEFGDIPMIDDANCTDWSDSRAGTEISSGIALNQTFATKYDVVQAVKSWHIEHSVRYKVLRSTQTLLVLNCLNEDKCNWYFRAVYKKSINMFKVTKLICPHTCSNVTLLKDHKQLDSDFVAEFVLPVVKADLKLNIAAIQEIVKARYQFTISYRKAWCAKQKVMERLFGSFEESYNMLPKFFNAMQQSNPGSIVHWVHKAEFNDFAVFGRVFWTFKPSIDGFQYCRPLISIDGTHLYGKYKGKLLVAVAYDANNGLFPLCFAIVNEESNSTWSWFLACIRHFVTNRSEICIISDRHLGIKHAVANTWPSAHHRYCSRHMASNFMERFRQLELKQAFNALAKEPSRRKFDARFQQLGRVNNDVVEWLNREPKEKWALSYDDGHRYGNMTTNMSEIFNSVMKGGRFLPITALVQLTFYRCNSFFVTRRMNAESFLEREIPWPPSVFMEISKDMEASKMHTVVMFGHRPGYFQVKTVRRRTSDGYRGEEVCTVSFDDHSCTCQRWHLYHRPCSHVLACCAYHNLDYSQFVDQYLTVNSYQMTYNSLFHPIVDQLDWPSYDGPKLLADDSLRRCNVGRARSTRLTNEMDMREGRSQNKCSVCGQKGHNSRRHHTAGRSKYQDSILITLYILLYD